MRRYMWPNSCLPSATVLIDAAYAASRGRFTLEGVENHAPRTCVFLSLCPSFLTFSLLPHPTYFPPPFAPARTRAPVARRPRTAFSSAGPRSLLRGSVLVALAPALCPSLPSHHAATRGRTYHPTQPRAAPFARHARSTPDHISTQRALSLSTHSAERARRTHRTSHTAGRRNACLIAHNLHRLPADAEDVGPAAAREPAAGHDGAAVPRAAGRGDVRRVPPQVGVPLRVRRRGLREGLHYVPHADVCESGEPSLPVRSRLCAG